MTDYTLTTVDVIVWGTLRNNRVAHSIIKQGIRVNVSRWFNFIEETNPWTSVTVHTHMNAADASGKGKGGSSKKDVDGDGGKQKQKGGAGGSGEGDANYDIGLQYTSAGVVTRFPPEPSGYLHIGHAKAALLNDYLAHQKYPGNTLLLRFDDTNPVKEKQEFEDTIKEDLAMMGIKPDKVSHSSDYFQEMHDYCVQMLTEGNAYADDTEQMVMRDQRMKGIASSRRDEAPDDNLARFKQMEQGTEEGKRWFIRAKISADDPNKAMRDPVIYRCVGKETPHHRTGTKWAVYPTYDFACPVLDAVEGITHALRTTEYKDRDAQYQWMLKALKLRNVYNWDFSRMNFIRTLLSKRKLTKFVSEGVVWGWDDPRMPTVRGIRRRGMTVEALQEFILKQGPSKNIVNLDWTLFWATNKKYIDPSASRYTAIAKQNAVKAKITNYPTERGEKFYTEKKPLHMKYNLGEKDVAYAPQVLIEQEDAASFKECEEITLMNWGNAFVRNIQTSTSTSPSIITSLDLELHLSGDVRKTKKITWLAAADDEKVAPVSVEVIDFDYLITKDKLEEEDKAEDFMTKQTLFVSQCWADANVRGLKRDEVMQFDRKGYCRVDVQVGDGEEGIGVFFVIPTGKTGK